ncbi:ABC transporter permease [Candidatus Kaiserbacteria bacterium]|nr:ABC transporter permease [Candidatus Kaiserbacteria bacterium]
MERRLYWILSDFLVLVGRSLKHIFKNMDQLLSLTIQPVMFMLLFGYVFGGAIQTGGVSYINFLVAGILVQMSAFGATTTSLSIATDMRRGIIDRLKTLPILSSAVMVGHVTADLVRNLVSAAVLIAVAFLMGFRPVASVSDWLAIVGLLIIFTLAISWLFTIAGLLAKSIEAVQWMGFFIVFPLTFASAAFVPTESMPKYLRIFAENQPVTHTIEAIRAYMLGLPVGSHALIATLWWLAVIAITIPVAGSLFRTRILS